MGAADLPVVGPIPGPDRPGMADAELRLLTRMRGDDPVGDELKQAKGLGYYEALIWGPGGSDDGDGKGDGFPPGYVAIADSGLLELDPGYRRWRLRPGLDARWNGTSFRTNGLGYRGPEIGPENSSGTFRVVVLGSSNTMGHGIDDEDGYVRRFERWLAGELGPSRKVEVVNLAVPVESPASGCSGSAPRSSRSIPTGSSATSLRSTSSSRSSTSTRWSAGACRSRSPTSARRSDGPASRPTPRPRSSPRSSGRSTRTCSKAPSPAGPRGRGGSGPHCRSSSFRGPT